MSNGLSRVRRGEGLDVATRIRLVENDIDEFEHGVNDRLDKMDNRLLKIVGLLLSLNVAVISVLVSLVLAR